ncbi:MAG: ATP-binding protein, partial [Desulfobulbaceae bacterium]|nr:ATP-binding protein [Desulfobulbaceae bacterium]
MEPLKSCTGGSAEGKNRFFKRPKIIQKIRRKLANGEHLLISAPRRIGKTSILKYIRDTPEQNQIIKYLIVQSVGSIDEFNKRLFDELINDHQIYSTIERLTHRAGATVKSQASRVKTISPKLIELNKDVTIDYYAELNELFDELKDHDKQIIIFIDEFPDTIININKTNPYNASRLLQQQREIREKYKNSQIQFVYTGSTGLKNVVKKLGDIHLVNNLVEIKVPPLRPPEALELMQRLILGKQQALYTFDVSDEVIAYTLETIQWLLPYYIQIIVEGLFDQHEEDDSDPPPPITTKTIDALLKALVKSNSTCADYFDH